MFDPRVLTGIPQLWWEGRTLKHSETLPSAVQGFDWQSASPVHVRFLLFPCTLVPSGITTVAREKKHLKCLWKEGEER